MKPIAKFIFPIVFACPFGSYATENLQNAPCPDAKQQCIMELLDRYASKSSNSQAASAYLEIGTLHLIVNNTSTGKKWINKTSSRYNTIKHEFIAVGKALNNIHFMDDDRAVRHFQNINSSSTKLFYKKHLAKYFLYTCQAGNSIDAIESFKDDDPGAAALFYTRLFILARQSDSKNLARSAYSEIQDILTTKVAREKKIYTANNVALLLIQADYSDIAKDIALRHIASQGNAGSDVVKSIESKILQAVLNAHRGQVDKARNIALSASEPSGSVDALIALSTYLHHTKHPDTVRILVETINQIQQLGQESPGFAASSLTLLIKSLYFDKY